MDMMKITTSIRYIDYKRAKAEGWKWQRIFDLGFEQMTKRLPGAEKEEPDTYVPTMGEIEKIKRESAQKSKDLIDLQEKYLNLWNKIQEFQKKGGV